MEAGLIMGKGGRPTSTSTIEMGLGHIHRHKIPLARHAPRPRDITKAREHIKVGLDAMGFVLGSALAARLGRGFLPIRKAGKLCVDTDKVSYGNYSGRTQDMEMRTPAFAKGTRVLIADQWIETGGTMDGAVRLVERQGGQIAGMVAIAMEENAATDAYRAKYKVVTAVLQETRWQSECNAQRLSSFDTYEPTRTFPTAGRSTVPEALTS